MTSLVLDSNALTAWTRDTPRLVAILEAVRQAHGIVFVPTVCLVESLTGTPADTSLNQRLKGTRPVALDSDLARDAATLRAAVDHDDVADPVVVATAARLRATVVSSDADLRQLATYAAPAVPVIDPSS